MKTNLLNKTKKNKKIIRKKAAAAARGVCYFLLKSCLPLS